MPFSFSAGLSAMGGSLASTANAMILEKQRDALEMRKIQLANDLTAQREHTARAETGAPEEVETKRLGLRVERERQKLLYGDDGSTAPPAASPGATSSEMDDGSTAPPQSEGAAAPPDRTIPTGNPKAPGTLNSLLPPGMSPETARYMAIVDPKGFSELITKWHEPQSSRTGNTITYYDPVQKKQVELYRNTNEVRPFNAEDRQKFNLDAGDKGYVENGKPVLLRGQEALVQVSDGKGGTIWKTREDAVNQPGPKMDNVTATDDPIVQSHITNVLNGNETMQNVPAAYKNAVSLGITNRPKNSFSPLAQQRLTLAASRIIQNYIKSPQFELTMNGLPYLQRIDAAAKVPGSVSDQDLLDSLTKLNTAGNAITDAQVKIITDGKSLSDTVGVMFNRLKNGGVLSDNQRQQIQDIAKGIYANYRKGFQPIYDEVTDKLRTADIPEQFWSLPNYSKLADQALAPSEAAAGADIGAPPPGVSPDLWQHSTPEERALWKR